MTVGGEMPGGRAVPGPDGRVSVSVKCLSSRPLDKVELVADGRTLEEWRCRGSLSFEFEGRLPARFRWILARAFALEEERPRDGHSMEPLLASGCIAFTNPVFVGEREE